MRWCVTCSLANELRFISIEMCREVTAILELPQIICVQNEKQWAEKKSHGGTPNLSVFTVDTSPLDQTECFRLVRYERNQIKAVA